MAKIYKRYLSFFFSFSLLSLSLSFLCLSLSSLASSSLYTLVAIFTDSKVPVYCRIRALYYHSHSLYTRCTWMACQSYFVVFTVCIWDIWNIHIIWMACQSYFIILTVCTCDVRNLHRLPPSVGLAPINSWCFHQFCFQTPRNNQGLCDKTHLLRCDNARSG